MPSFSTALSGLQADSIALSTIGNNLANLNTKAFKQQTANFADLFYQTVGSSGSNQLLQVGSGTRVASVESDFSSGNIIPANGSTNMALNGDGFFVVNQTGANVLTRAGNFQLSPTGDLITSDGYRVQGYPAVNGSIDLNAPLQAMNVATSKTQHAHPTSQFQFTTSLNSAATTGTQFTAATSVYDSWGTAHNMTVTFTRVNANEWNYDVELPAGEAATASGNTGTLVFKSDGSLSSPATDVADITFKGLTDNASDMVLKWQLRDARGNSLINQGSADSSTATTQQDGFASGTYKSFAVDPTGIMTATYTNGGTEVLGQIAVAAISNPQALQRQGSNLFTSSEASGPLNLGVAGSGGRGSIKDNSLEESNVDISTEFAKLIVAQRSFEANSKTVTAFDTITQSAIGMVR